MHTFLFVWLVREFYIRRFVRTGWCGYAKHVAAFACTLRD